MIELIISLPVDLLSCLLAQVAESGFVDKAVFLAIRVQQNGHHNVRFALGLQSNGLVQDISTRLLVDSLNVLVVAADGDPSKGLGPVDFVNLVEGESEAVLIS